MLGGGWTRGDKPFIYHPVLFFPDTTLETVTGLELGLIFQIIVTCFSMKYFVIDENIRHYKDEQHLAPPLQTCQPCLTIFEIESRWMIHWYNILSTWNWDDVTNSLIDVGSQFKGSLLSNRPRLATCSKEHFTSPTCLLLLSAGDGSPLWLKVCRRHIKYECLQYFTTISSQNWHRALTKISCGNHLFRPMSIAMDKNPAHQGFNGHFYSNRPRFSVPGFVRWQGWAFGHLCDAAATGWTH